ncbi:alpha/beta hydrolase [Amycolatopsis sp. NPDC021455]|uniref:alpha/beta fold hydrolase n=1 Tax=Amycolatopsis sp. NPDC021455 TaxID=3154901 RepID=UPI003410449C
MTTSRRSLLAGSAAIAAAAAVGTTAGAPAAQAQPRPAGKQKPTVVLVHGAFADASGWYAVANHLSHAGYPVIAPANPLRGLTPDTAYLKSILATLGGPLVLAAHSYGGNVITNAATGNPNVQALVYVAAFATEQGESLKDLQTKYPGSRVDETALDFRPNGESVDAYIKKAVFHDVFAGDVPKATTDPMWAGQRPIDVRALGEPSGVPAWKTIPSWYLVARDDNVFPAAGQRFAAQRAGAHTVEVSSSHVAMISQPAATAELIKRAAC